MFLVRPLISRSTQRPSLANFLRRPLSNEHEIEGTARVHTTLGWNLCFNKNLIPSLGSLRQLMGRRAIYCGNLYQQLGVSFGLIDLCIVDPSSILHEYRSSRAV